MADEHGHEEHSDMTLWEEAWEIFTDPAHILPEIAWHIIIELVIVTLIYGLLIKKVIIPKLRKDIHKDIDKEHGYKHDEHEKDSK
jgi:p-aminobenzoyl-glutamate transporter AbgT